MVGRASEFETNLVYSAIQDDEKLKEYIRALAWKVIQRAEYLLDNGHVSIQVQVMKNIMPAVTKSLSNQAEDEKFVKMRSEFEQLLKEILPNQMTVDEPDDDLE